MLARDLSNFSKPLTPAVLDEWKTGGTGLIICQAVDPPSPYPATQTRAQIDACLAAGLLVDVYVWLWMDLDGSDIAAKLALLSGYEGKIRQLWLDVEDLAAQKYNQPTTESKIVEALALCDAYLQPTSGAPTGIYTGRWFWADHRYAGNTAAFSNRKLWDSNYDNIADAAAGFIPYGGWTECAIKQYSGSQPDGTDLDILSAAEAASLTQPQPAPAPVPDPTPTPPVPDDPCAAITIAHDALVVTVADIADRLGDALLAECKRLLPRRSVIRGIVAQMAQERTQSIGSRP